MFFAYQMLLIRPRSREYADVLELALYNAVLVGVSLDGKKFFYENPPATVGKRYERSAWFDCSCCPPNVSPTYLAACTWVTDFDCRWLG